VQQHSIRQHRVVRPTKVVNPDIEQPRRVTRGLEHLHEGQRPVRPQHSRTPCSPVAGRPPWAAADGRRRAGADQPRHLLQVSRNGWTWGRLAERFDLGDVARWSLNLGSKGDPNPNGVHKDLPDEVFFDVVEALDELGPLDDCGQSSDSVPTVLGRPRVRSPIRVVLSSPSAWHHRAGDPS